MIRGESTAEPPAMVRALSREQLHWNRPMFKAPPLRVVPPTFDFAASPLGLGKFVRKEKLVG